MFFSRLSADWGLCTTFAGSVCFGSFQGIHSESVRRASCHTSESADFLLIIQSALLVFVFFSEI